MKLAAALLVAALPAFAQITASASPEPMAVTQNIPVKVIGLWDVRLCNDSAMSLTIPEEKVFMAFPTLPLMTAKNATIVLMTRQAKNKKQIAVDLITYGLLVAVPILSWGPVAASKTVIGATGVGLGVAGITRDSIKAQVPSISPLTADLLSGPIQLNPGQCVTKSVFSAKVPAAMLKTVSTVLNVVSIPGPPLNGPSVNQPAK